MTKSELIEQVTTKMDLPKSQAEQVVNLVFQSMADTLSQKGRIEIRGFGSFSSKHYPAYQGRNPRTGEVIDVQEKWLPTFKAGKELRERVDNGEFK